MLNVVDFDKIPQISTLGSVDSVCRCRYWFDNNKNCGVE